MVAALWAHSFVVCGDGGRIRTIYKNKIQLRRPLSDVHFVQLHEKLPLLSFFLTTMKNIPLI